MEDFKRLGDVIFIIIIIIHADIPSHTDVLIQKR